MISLFLKIKLLVFFLFPLIGNNSQIFLSVLPVGSSEEYVRFEKKLENVIIKVNQRTSLMLAKTVVKIKPGDTPVQPFLIVFVSEIPDVKTKSGVYESIKKTVNGNGFVWIINSADIDKRLTVDTWIRSMVLSLFEGHTFTGLQKNSILYRCFYDLTGQSELFINEAIIEGENIIVLYTPFALKELSEQLIQFIINVTEYAVCSNYKDEQTHIEYILKKRNWKFNR